MLAEQFVCSEIGMDTQSKSTVLAQQRGGARKKFNKGKEAMDDMCDGDDCCDPDDSDCCDGDDCCDPDDSDCCDGDDCCDPDDSDCCDGDDCCDPDDSDCCDGDDCCDPDDSDCDRSDTIADRKEAARKAIRRKMRQRKIKKMKRNAKERVEEWKDRMGDSDSDCCDPDDSDCCDPDDSDCCDPDDSDCCDPDDSDCGDDECSGDECPADDDEGEDEAPTCERAWLKPESTAEFYQMLEDAGDVPVQVKWGAPWCGACVNIEDFMAELIAATDCSSMKFLDGNVDYVSSAASKAGIRYLPTFDVYVNSERQGGRFSGGDKTKI